MLQQHCLVEWCSLLKRAGMVTNAFFPTFSSQSTLKSRVVANCVMLTIPIGGAFTGLGNPSRFLGLNPVGSEPGVSQDC